MGRYIGPKCRLCRREGAKLFLKGARCYSEKCPIERKGAVPPGQHGQKRKRRISDYGSQLREKQKVKRIYGIRERQFRNYFQKAFVKKENTGKKLLELLERRLDNVIFRGGLVDSRSSGRQLITHGLCLVNNKKVDIPSYQVKLEDLITLNGKALALDKIKEVIKEKKVIPGWLKRKAVVLKVERFPERDDITENIDEQLIIEFYSR